MTIFKSIIPTAVITSLINTLTGIIESYIGINALNTDTGANSATINEKSGLAVFTDTITSGTVKTFTIYNSLITTSSLLSFGLQYNGTLTAAPVQFSYYPIGGAVSVYVKNVGSTTTDANIKIQFKLEYQ